MLLMCRGPWWPGLVSGTDSPHEEDRRDAGQRGDADGARRRAVVARILGHGVNLERALVVLVADERRDDDWIREALGSIVLGNVNCRGRRASRLFVDHWRFDPRAGDQNSSRARKEPPQLAYESPTVVEDHEDEIIQLLLDGGLNEAGRAAFCSATRKDCRGDAVEEAAKRQGIADLLAGINDDPPAAPAKKRRRKPAKKKKKPAAAEL